VFVVTVVTTGLVFTAVTSAFAWAGWASESRSGWNAALSIPRYPSLLLDAALIVVAASPGPSPRW
jgi:hypothetical protein